MVFVLICESREEGGVRKLEWIESRQLRPMRYCLRISFAVISSLCTRIKLAVESGERERLTSRLRSLCSPHFLSNRTERPCTLPRRASLTSSSPYDRFYSLRVDPMDVKRELVSEWEGMLRESGLRRRALHHLRGWMSTFVLFLGVLPYVSSCIRV